MPSEETKRATQREWRELGFFYDCDDFSKSWRIMGTVQGLQRFAHLVRAYAFNSKNESLSEHEHFGPYMFLEIGTWSHPEITSHWIAGSLRDLSTLATLIESVAELSAVGDRVSLRHQFAAESPYDLIIEVQNEPFDPARADTQCW